MKSKLTIILMLVCCLVQAQVKKDRNGKWARIGLMTGAIIFGAVGDGLQDGGKHKLAAHSFKTASALSLLSIPIVSRVSKKKAFKYVLSYGLMRHGIFDYSYNAARGLPINYIGTTSIHDKIIGGMPEPMLFMTRATSIWISIELNTREVK